MIDQTYLGNDGHSKTLRRFVGWDDLIGQEEFEGTVQAALRDPATTEVRVKKVGRNEPCPCGSGKKFKKCCLWKVNCGVEIVT